jgi:hypothetical protein
VDLRLRERKKELMLRTKTRSGTAAIVAVMVVTAAVGAGCGRIGGGDSPRPSADVVGDDGAAPTTDGDGATSAGSGSGAADTSTVDVSGTLLPRKVTYAGTEYVLTRAAPKTDPDKGPGVALDISVHNTGADEAGFYPEWVSLRDAKGTRWSAAGVVDPTDGLTNKEIYLLGGSKVDRTFFVPADGALHLADLRLSVAKGKGIPAEVPLSGAEPRSPYPVELTVPHDAPTFPARPPFTVTFTSAQLVEEWQDTRAEVGTHLVVMKIHVTAGSCDYCDGAAIGTGTVRLVIDGSPKEAEHQEPSGCCLIDQGVTKDLTEVFVVPDTYASVSLVVQGSLVKSKPEQQSFPFTIPPLPPVAGTTAGSVPTTRS